MYLFKGIAIGLTLGIPGVTIGGAVFSWNTTEYLGNASVLFLPVQLWIFIFIGIGFHIVLSKTYIGRWIYAIGRNENAIRFSGVNTKEVKLILYTVGGIAFAIAGMIFLGRFTSIKYDSADAYVLQVVTAVVLGGTSITGGFGNIKGTAIAVMILAVLKGGLNIMLVAQTQQRIVIGLILLCSLIVFALLETKGNKFLKKTVKDKGGQVQPSG
jgi:ribose/xylose/arabinose/galactoside ABC-type transport system permease subunit